MTKRSSGFLKIYNYKSSDEGVKKILGEISSLINEENYIIKVNNNSYKFNKVTGNLVSGDSNEE